MSDDLVPYDKLADDVFGKRGSSRRGKKDRPVGDLKGKRFGRLVAHHIGKPDGKHRTWVCACDCGTICTVRGEVLKRGKANSCGCLRRELGRARGKQRLPRQGVHPVKVGDEYGVRVVVAELPERDLNGAVRFLVRCMCGREDVVSSTDVRRSEMCRECRFQAMDVELTEEDKRP